MKEHPSEGARIAAPLLEWLGPWGVAIVEHHERFDGKGYPAGLGGSSISLAGRIVAVADSYDTMTAARSYKKPMAVWSARRELADCAGGQFDPEIVRAFLSISLPRLLWKTGPISFLVQLPVLARLQQVGLESVTAMTQGAAVATVAAGVTAMAVGGMVHAPRHDPVRGQQGRRRRDGVRGPGAGRRWGGGRSRARRIPRRLRASRPRGLRRLPGSPRPRPARRANPRRTPHRPDHEADADALADARDQRRPPTPTPTDAPALPRRSPPPTPVPTVPPRPTHGVSTPDAGDPGAGRKCRRTPEPLLRTWICRCPLSNYEPDRGWIAETSAGNLRTARSRLGTNFYPRKGARHERVSQVPGSSVDRVRSGRPRAGDRCVDRVRSGFCPVSRPLRGRRGLRLDRIHGRRRRTPTTVSAPDVAVSSGIAAPAWCCGASGVVPGLTTFGQATVEGQDPAARDAAIAAAVQDAMAQANAAAGAAGIQLGAIIDMQVSATPYYYPMMGSVSGSGSSPGSPGGGGMEPAPAPDMYLGSVSVTVTWSLG